MTDSDLERTAQACRAYEVLLNFYPASFRLAYGDILVQHFRDEYRNALAAGKRLALLRFWVFILFDFLRSLLMEVQEEVVKMVKKNFFVFCAVAAGLVSLLQLLIGSRFIHTTDKVDMWGQLLFWPLFLGCSSLALFGIAKATGSHVIFKIFSLFVLISAVSSLPIPSRNPSYGWVGRPAFTYLFNNEDRIFGYFMTAYLLLTAIITIVALVKKQWLPGGCLLAMSITMWVPNIGYSLSEDSFIVENTWNSDWYPLFLVVLSMAAWFTIAWWLNKGAGSNQTLQAA
jgi:hypothetical protein